MAGKTKKPARKKKTKPVSQSLRQAIKDSGLTHYRIGKETGISPMILDFFVANRRSLSLRTVDKVCGLLGLELVHARAAR